MFSIVPTKVKLKLIEITFCRLIAALSRVKEGRLMACVPLSEIGEDGCELRKCSGEVMRDALTLENNASM